MNSAIQSLPQGVVDPFQNIESSAELQFRRSAKELKRIDCIKVRTRFLGKIQRLDNGCWVWSGRVSEKGYGQFRVNKKLQWAHRASYAIFKGDIPGEMTVDHECRNCSCVNPDHLKLMTHTDNTADGNRNRSSVSEAQEEIPF